MEVGLALQQRQIDDAELADGLDIIGVLDAGLHHRRAGRLDRPLNAGFADEHMVGFFGQHEPAGARQRIESAFGQRRELHLAVAVGEVGEHEERQPVRRAFIEGAEDARVVLLAALALEQRLGFLAPVLAEIFDQQIDHGPQVPALLDVDLEQVAHVVEARRGLAQEALLLDRGRLRVALHDDETASSARYSPGTSCQTGSPLWRPNGIVRPSTFGASRMPHRYVGIFTWPNLAHRRVHTNGGAQIDLRILKALRTHAVPPFEIFGRQASSARRNCLSEPRATLLGMVSS